ncbi:MAG TPA: TetR/AcrR family transcriptional regulator [Mycobacteriales bacterium]|jgi:AcrR family transcriptional regulator|nr:TetR/AcrR family transcriptional regulator [Mycobacteriales bacterium]
MERRSQAERTEQMRARLLSATIECLAETGYGRMSTNDIVRRARVSRGALAHHFPTKAALVTAAAERLVDQRGAEFRERLSAVEPERRTPDEALAVLWSFYDDPTGLALIELTVAARAYPELKVVLGRMAEQIGAITAEMVLEYFPDLAQLPFIEEALRSLHALYAGLALSAMAGAEAEVQAQRVREFLGVLALNMQVSTTKPQSSKTLRSKQ